jgi:hypothetical protein
LACAIAASRIGTGDIDFLYAGNGTTYMSGGNIDAVGLSILRAISHVGRKACILILSVPSLRGLVNLKKLGRCRSGGARSGKSLVRPFLVAALVGASLAVQSSELLAEDIIRTCALPNNFGAALIPPENRLGEYFVELKPPQYGNRDAVRDHFRFSRLWSRILRSSIKAKTHDSCDAVVDASFFPNLSAYLINNWPRDPISDKTRCVDALQAGLQESEQDPAAIRAAASDEASALQRWSNSQGSFIVEADNILKRSMQLIYRYGTIMESLASVEIADFQEIEPAAFRRWLQEQHSYLRVARIEFSDCAGGSGMLALGADRAIVDRLPESTALDPGSISLKMSDQNGNSPLHSAVIIGLRTPPFHLPGATAAVQADVLTGYCNRERTFSEEVDRREVTVTVRCLRVVELTRPWVVLFCDPKDCTTKHSAQAVAGAIVGDPEIVALARANAEHMRPVGPYLINLQE